MCTNISLKCLYSVFRPAKLYFMFPIIFTKNHARTGKLTDPSKHEIFISLAVFVRLYAYLYSPILIKASFAFTHVQLTRCTLTKSYLVKVSQIGPTKKRQYLLVG